MKEALSSSETSVLIRASWRNIPENAFLQLKICCEESRRHGQEQEIGIRKAEVVGMFICDIWQGE
jgi:hypothetical protein